MKFDKNKAPKFLVDISKKKPQRIHIFSGDTLIDEIDLQQYYEPEVADEIHQRIFKTYKAKGYSDSVLKEIQKNIDPGVYEALRLIDEKTGTTRKSKAYVDTMLRYYRVKTNETPEEYAKRVAANKQELLDIHDIEIQYNTGLFGMKETAPYEKVYKGKAVPNIKGATSSVRNLHFSKFGKESDLELKVVNKEDLKDDLKDILDGIKEEPEESIGGFLHRGPSKERTHIFGLPKGWGKRRKEEKEKKPSVFRKAVLTVAIVAAVAGVAIGARGCSANKTVDEPAYTTEYSTEDSEYSNEDNIVVIPPRTDESEQETTTNTTEETQQESTAPSETEATETADENTPSGAEVENSENNNNNNNGTQAETGDEENQAEAASNQESEKEVSSESATSENATIDSTTLLKNLMCYSGVGFNTEFQMSQGTYYETPEGTGASGHYANYSSSNVKINRVDILKDGVYYKQYTVKDGDFSEVLEQYLNDSSYTFSFHVQTVDGTTLGWDNSEDLQKIVLTQYVSNLDIAQETKDAVLNAISQGENITPEQLNDLLNQLPSLELGSEIEI